MRILLFLSLAAFCAAYDPVRIIIDNPAQGSVIYQQAVQATFRVSGVHDFSLYTMVLTFDGEDIELGGKVLEAGVLDLQEVGIGTHTLKIKARNSNSIAETQSNEVKFSVAAEDSSDRLEMEMMPRRSDPSLWEVSGSALLGGSLGGQVELIIQPRDEEGNYIAALDDIRTLSVVIEPQQIDQQMEMVEEGVIVLWFSWRIVGEASISINIHGETPIADSPYHVLVQEKLATAILGSPLLVPLAPVGTNTSACTAPSSSTAPASCAFATILTNDAFCTGVLTMHYSLRLTNASFPLLCLVTEKVSCACKDLIAHAGMVLMEVETIPNPNAGHKQHFEDVYSKLHVFGLEGFSKVVFLDADMLVLRNIDHLFAYPSLSAAPEINPPALFNSGLMVLSPSPSLLRLLLRRAPLVPSYDKTDQGFLNEIWAGQWTMLPYTYNFLKDRGAIPDRFDGFVQRDLQQVYVVHITGEKPWHCRADAECNVRGRLSPHLWNLWHHYHHLLCTRTERPLSCTPWALL